MLHIFPHWNWAGREGEEIDVWCYSNCDEVELFVNGKSQGRKNMVRNSHLEWKVKYEPGMFEAKGYKDGQQVSVKKVETTGEPAQLELTADRLKIRADNEDVAMVTVAVLDEQGRIVLIADNEVTFGISRNAKISGVGNGNPSSHEPDKATKRKVFNGLCQVIIQSRWKPGEIRLKARSPRLRPSSLVICAGACEAKAFVPSLAE